VVQARRGKAAKAQAGERKLLAAMQASPGVSANALAKAAAMSRSTAADGLQRLAKRGAIEKDGDGRWRVRGEAASQTQGAARPTQPSPAAS
jgi:DNA-binding IclR family transcriptional regulator